MGRGQEVCYSKPRDAVCLCHRSPPLHATRHLLLLLLTSEVGLRLRDPDFAPLLLSSRFVLRKCRPPSLPPSSFLSSLR